MGSAFISCQKCRALVKYGEHKFASNKKFYCKTCYNLVEGDTSDRLIKITASLPRTAELRGGKVKDDSQVKSAPGRRKKVRESKDSEGEV